MPLHKLTEGVHFGRSSSEKEFPPGWFLGFPSGLSQSRAPPPQTKGASAFSCEPAANPQKGYPSSNKRSTRECTWKISLLLKAPPVKCYVSGTEGTNSKRRYVHLAVSTEASLQTHPACPKSFGGGPGLHVHRPGPVKSSPGYQENLQSAHIKASPLVSIRPIFFSGATLKLALRQRTRRAERGDGACRLFGQALRTSWQLGVPCPPFKKTILGTQFG